MERNIKKIGLVNLLVFLFGVVLSLCCPGLGREDLSRHNLWLKGISTALVMLGLLAMNV